MLSFGCGSEEHRKLAEVPGMHEDCNLEAKKSSASGEPQQPSRVLVVHLLQNRVAQLNSVDLPAALRRNLRRRVIEVLIVALEEAVVDLVQGIAKYLLGKLIAVGSSVRAEHDPVLILIEKPAGGTRLAAEFANAGSDVN